MSRPLMLRGAPSALRPQRSIEIAWVMPARRHVSIIAATSAASTGTPETSAPANAAAQALRHGSSVASRQRRLQAFARGVVIAGLDPAIQAVPRTVAALRGCPGQTRQ